NRFVAGFIGSPAMNFLPGTLHREGEGLLFQAAGGEPRVGLPAALAPRLEGRPAAEVVLGVRPEDLHLARGRYRPEAGEEIDARVEVVEPMGNEAIVYASAGSHELVARLPPHDLPTPGEVTRLVID